MCQSTLPFEYSLHIFWTLCSVCFLPMAPCTYVTNTAHTHTPHVVKLKQADPRCEICCCSAMSNTSLTLTVTHGFLLSFMYCQGFIQWVLYSFFSSKCITKCSFVSSWKQETFQPQWKPHTIPRSSFIEFYYCRLVLFYHFFFYRMCFFWGHVGQEANSDIYVSKRTEWR